MLLFRTKRPIYLHGAEGARGGQPSHLRNTQAKKPLEGPSSEHASLFEIGICSFKSYAILQGDGIYAVSLFYVKFLLRTFVC